MFRTVWTTVRPLIGNRKSAMKAALTAIALSGGLLAAPVLPKPALQVKPQAMQLTATGSAASEPESEVDKTAVLGIALAGSAAIGVGLSLILDRSRSSKSATNFRSGFHSDAGRQPHQTVSLDQANRRLQRKLLSLLHDNRGAAHRLLMQAWLKYPGKVPDWYVEKVIYDLERDRGKY